MAVSGVVAALALTGWQRTLLSARNTQCLTNLRAIGTAATAYSAENDGLLPTTAHLRNSWIGSLEPYLGTRRPYKCPLDRNASRVTSYALNDCLAPVRGRPNFGRRQNISRPAETMFMAETSEQFSGGDHFHFLDEETGEVIVTGVAAEVAAARHSVGGNYLFVDGHVENLSAVELARRVSAAGSCFINPAP